jgi:glucose-6-phosphate 1-epimerase
LIALVEAMDDLAQFNSRFAIPRVVKFEAGEGGLTRIAVTGRLAEAHVYLHGAHITHYQPREQQPVLFLSRESQFAPDKPIRGGVPVIFPWFGPRAGDPSAPQHGFARTFPWDVLAVKTSGGAVGIRLGLRSSDQTLGWLAEDFEVAYTVWVGKTLELSLEVRNRSPGDFQFEEALHTYLNIGDVREASVEGLGGGNYLDKTAAMARKTQPAGPMRIEAETDRIYLNTAETVTVSDPTLRRKISVAKSGSSSTVVWNPWMDKATAMTDFDDDEWAEMLCIETANVADDAIHLPPGQIHTMKATISVTSITT